MILPQKNNLVIITFKNNSQIKGFVKFWDKEQICLNNEESDIYIQAIDEILMFKIINNTKINNQLKSKENKKTFEASFSPVKYELPFIK